MVGFWFKLLSLRRVGRFVDWLRRRLVVRVVESFRDAVQRVGFERWSGNLGLGCFGMRNLKWIEERDDAMDMVPELLVS